MVALRERAASAPVFPLEKQLELPRNATPLAHVGSVQVFVQLAEPVIFLQGYDTHQWHERAPSILRGSLVVRILKPTKLKSISLMFKGVCRTEWPEGIPPKKQEVVEVTDLLNHTWLFYHVDSHDKVAAQSEDLLARSDASLYRPLPAATQSNKGSSVSLQTLLSQEGGELHGLTPADEACGRRSTSTTRSLSSGKLLRRKGSPDPPRVRSGTNLFTELLSATLSNGSEGSVRSRSSHTGHAPAENFVFQPGDYIYSFEHPIPVSTQETILATFGTVNYLLDVTIERIGAFKSNVHARVPIKLIRTLSPNSVEDTEPIVISRDWEKELSYEIVIASKDIVLDAFLPISLSLNPRANLVLHRVRIFLTETLEYYCKGRKVHRVEPTKKFLLVEHKAPPLKGIHEGASLSRAKNLGNLLDDGAGGASKRQFTYQVFVPERLNYQQCIHPNTASPHIKSNHWLQICLRLSRKVNGSRKHYEISIDTPIHVLHRLCSHAHTLLPSYESQAVLTSGSTASSSLLANQYHSSNMYFPKEALQAAKITPPAGSVENLSSYIDSPAPVHNNKNHQYLAAHRNSAKENDGNGAVKFHGVAWNIYHPAYLPFNFISPQALPISPILPLFQTRFGHMGDNLNAFVHVGDIDRTELSNVGHRDNDHMPDHPPSYEEALEAVELINMCKHNGMGLTECSPTEEASHDVNHFDGPDHEDMGDSSSIRSAVRRSGPPSFTSNISALSALAINQRITQERSERGVSASVFNQPEKLKNEIPSAPRNSQDVQNCTFSDAASSTNSDHQLYRTTTSKVLLDLLSKDDTAQSTSAGLEMPKYSDGCDTIPPSTGTEADDTSVDISTLYSHKSAQYWSPIQCELSRLSNGTHRNPDIYDNGCLTPAEFGASDNRCHERSTDVVDEPNGLSGIEDASSSHTQLMQRDCLKSMGTPPPDASDLYDSTPTQFSVKVDDLTVQDTEVNPQQAERKYE
ncbi:AFR101Cp [Eremothecium gossypii ATCC 10895]|uniref:AFR101Cp n=1 Tax=Eremothecium gossypii (strain ATCC 10895 / CBS 109.51 / FGSC 9923 / NRRL Y-1056) TaxID=284811 RepID=Q754G9_EREGS|nr:AFR101Cp [Eremothecium gossypii ATCC 10895]AAS53472.2 AFR101Cp [Eremothecium gossypii ATCC 10895]AEY97784.1 FAFR101Cp [Eremothecium gossypii FDAG1]